MGLTERHWFEDEEPELTERQLEDDISIQDRVYRRGYQKGYSDGIKEQEEQIKNRDESLEKAREEIKWLRGMLKEQEEEIEPVFVENPHTHSPVSYCPKCREPISKFITGNPYKETKYCHYCGQAVKWE